MMESFKDLLDSHDIGFCEGLVKGTVVRKTNDGVLIDLKSKAEKFIPKSEFFEEEWEDITEGKDINVFVEKGKVSYGEARKLLVIDEMKEIFKNHEPIDIKIKKEVKGGYIASYKGFEIFIPSSLAGKAALKSGHMVKTYIKNIEEDGKKIICSIVDYEKEVKKLILNEFFSTKNIGDVLSGKVKNIIDKGVFIELGGIDGFIPFSELTHKKIKDPSHILKVGEEVKVKIIELNADNKKVTLSMKALEEDPWQKFIKIYKENEKVNGVVTNIINHGVFVEILDGVEGFMHISEISWTERIKHPSKYFKIGDHITCIIKKIDKENKKISLSFKEMLINPWEEFLNINKIGSTMNVTIKKIVDKGIVISLPNGLEGFIPDENITWGLVSEAKKGFNEGQELTVKLIAGDIQRKRLIFSIKDLTKDPWEDFSRQYKIGDEIEGVVKNINEKLIFVEVAPFVEGIVKKSEFIREKKDALPKDGDKLNLLIKDMNLQKKRLLLSYQDLVRKRDAEAMAELKKSGSVKVTLGDFFKK